MSYRYQEILAWIIPGFFFISLIILVWGISIDIFSILIPDSTQNTEVNNSLLSQYTSSAQFWNAVAAILLFLIPIMSLIV